MIVLSGSLWLSCVCASVLQHLILNPGTTKSKKEWLSYGFHLIFGYRFKSVLQNGTLCCIMLHHTGYYGIMLEQHHEGLAGELTYPSLPTSCCPLFCQCCKCMWFGPQAALRQGAYPLDPLRKHCEASYRCSDHCIESAFI